MALVVVTGPIIRAGESLSEGLDLSSGELLRLTMPLDWTPAPLSFQLSSDGIHYNDAFHLSGFEVSMTTVFPNSVIIVPYDVGRAIAWLKVRSGTRDKPILQQADRTFAVDISTSAPTSTGKPSSGWVWYWVPG
jgi:hypothetical protein